MSLLDAQHLRSPSVRSAALSSLSALSIVVLAIFQSFGSACQSERSDAILYKSMLLGGTNERFDLLWSFQFLNPTMLNKSRRDDMTKAMGLEAHVYYDQQQALIAAYNDDCGIWTWLSYAAMVIAFLLQVMAIHFGLIAARLASAGSP